MSQRTILIIDDNPGDCELYSTYLSQSDEENYRVVAAATGEEALEYLREETPDCVLLDYQLPDMNGLELFTTLKADQRVEKFPVVMLTGTESAKTAVNALKEGMQDYLFKNAVTEAILVRTIRQAIKAHDLHQEAIAQREQLKAQRAELALRQANLEVVNQALQESESRLQMALQTSDLGIWDWDMVSHQVLIDDYWLAFEGKSFEPLSSRIHLTLENIHPEDRQRVEGALQDHISEETLPFNVEYRIESRSGEWVWVHSRGKVQERDAEGRPTRMVGMIHDVSARKEVELALRESERRYRGIVENIPGMIYRVLRRRSSRTSEFMYVSAGSRALFGVTPEEIIADPLLIRRMVHPEEDAEYERVTSQANLDARAWRWQGRFILPSGEIKIIQGFGHPDLQSNGDIIWDGLMMDVTERVHAQQKAAQLAAIVESSGDAIKSKTLDGIVTSWNAGAEAMYGYTAEEMIGHSINRVLPPDRPNEIATLLKRIANGESVKSYETKRLTKDGNLLDIALTMSPIKDNTGKVTGAASIAQDIRHRIVAQERIEQQMMRIQALRNIDMAITASLDLRVTLNVLLDQVTSQLKVDSAAILILNPHTYRLEYAAGRGFRTGAICNTNLRIGEGIAGRAAFDRKLQHIPDLEQAGREFVRNEMLRNEEFVGYWVVPLIAKGQVEGVLELFHRAPMDCDADWTGFFEALAGQAAIAIENATLFNNLQLSNVELQLAYDSTLEGWSRALDLRDKETEGHTLRVTDGTMTLARSLHIKDEEMIQIRRGALLHDIGKMGIPDNILLKPGKLTEEEWEIMRKHPVYAYELLSPIAFLRPALDIPYCHHEKWDGSGYPRGLKGEQIPLSARLFAIVDVWDALRSDRPYRQAWTNERVREHIIALSGTHFDPKVVDAFLNVSL